MRALLLLLVTVATLYAERIDLSSGEIVLGDTSVAYSSGALPIDTAGIYQFSTHFTLDTTMESPALFLGAMYYPCVVSLNGYKIYQWGTLDSLGGMCNYGSNAVIIPDRVVRERNCLTIEFWSDGLVMGLADRWVGTREEVTREAERRNAFNQTGIRVGVVVSFLVALLAFFAYFAMKKKQHLVLSFAFFTVVMALSFHIFVFNSQFIDHLTQTYIFRTATILMVYSLFGCITEVTNTFRNRWIKVIHFIIILPFILLVWSSGSKYEIELLLSKVASFYIVPVLLMNVVLLVRSIFLKQGRIYWFILVNYVILVYSAFNDLASLKMQMLPKYWMVPYGYLFIVVSILTYLISIQFKIYNENTEMSDELKSLNNLLSESNENLLSANNAIEKESDMREAFIKTVAHELRTPLNGLVGGVDMILDDEAIPDHLKEPLFHIKSSFHRLIITVSNLFDYVEMSNGEIQIIPHSFIVMDAVNPILENYRQSALAKGISLIALPTKGIPQKLYGDSEHLVQVIDNVLENAIKFTDSGGVSFSMFYTDNALTFEIMDTGKGIDEELKKAMFEAFSRGETYSYSQQYEGVGLGLAIVDNVVKAMKGTLSFSSTTDVGTKFTISLPMVLHHAKKITFATKRRVLIVEDNIVNSIMVRKQLECGSFIVEVVDNGEKAVTICREKEYDAILMDIQMPIMDGITATKEIRKFNSTVPIIALTANGNERECRSAGANTLITKPSTVEKLITVVSEQIINAETDIE